MKKYNHMIWDWNGTLLNDAWLCVDIMNGMLTEHGLQTVTLDYYRKVFDFPVRDYYIRLGFDFERESFKKVGMEFMIRYNERQKECSLHPEVKDIMEVFRRSGWGQSILSAREESELRMETGMLGVSSYLKFIYGLDDHYAHGKTDVGHRLIRDLNLKEESLLFIGDTCHDAEVARELGIDCILIPNGHNSRERLEICGNTVLSSLSDLVKEIL